MSKWDRTHPPDYVPASQANNVQYDDSGYWIVKKTTDLKGNPRIREELLVTVANAAPSGITKRMGPGVPSMPNGALGIWYTKDAETSPRKTIPNSISVIQGRDANLLFAPRRLYSTGHVLRNAITVVDNAAVAPDGSMTASTMVATAGSNWLVGIAAGTLPAAQRIVCVTIKYIGTGSAPKIRLGGVATGLQTSTSWQRLTVLTASNHTGGTVGIQADSAADEANFAFCDLELFDGTVDLNPNPLGAKPLVMRRNDLFIGRSPSESSSIVSDGVLKAGSRAYAHFDTPPDLSAFTVIAVLKQTGVSTNLFQPIMVSCINGTQGFVYDNFAVGPAASTTPRIRMNGVTTGTKSITNPQDSSGSDHLWGDNHDGPFVSMHRWDGTKGSSWINGIKMTEDAQTITPPVIGDFVIGEFAGNYGGLDFSAIAFYTRALSDAEMIQAYYSLKANVTDLATAPKRIVLMEGDSITAQNASAGKYIRNAWGVNGAHAGDTVSLISNRATAVDAFAAKVIEAGHTPILTVLIGTNSIASLTDQSSRDAYNATLQSYLSARKAAGWKIVLCTITPSYYSTDATKTTNANTSRNYLNPIMRTWVGTYCDAIADYAADPTIGPDAAAQNTTYYVDGIHQTQAGRDITDPILGAAVATIP